MSLQIGIVGLPNVGKSTLFNALTKSRQAAAENFPFCTIDPNVGVVNVPDHRLDEIAKIVNPQKITYSTIEFVDIAGLVRGASKGEGLGNQFLHHIRECDAIAFVIRFFEDENVLHVYGKVDPKSDREIIEAELIFADLETVNKNIVRLEKDKKSGAKEVLIKHEMCLRIRSGLESGKKANLLEYHDEEKPYLQELHLMTAKPFLFLANISENSISGFDLKKAKEMLSVSAEEQVIPISAKIEADLADFTPEEAAELLASLNMKESGLSAVIRAAYGKLGLESYLTGGEKEARAWTFHRGSTAPVCAGIIHSDFEKHFIKADVVPWDVFVKNKGWHGCRELGLVRSEGKEYIMKDGDVILFKTSV